MSKTKLFAPIFDIPKDVLEKGRFNITFIPINIISENSVRTEIEGCDIPSGTLLRITDYNILTENGEEFYEVIGVSYVNLANVHIVGSKETDISEHNARKKFYLYDEKRGGESIVDLIGENKVKTLVEGYEIDSNGNVESIIDKDHEEDHDNEKVSIEQIVEDNDSDDDETDLRSMVGQLEKHFNGDEDENEKENEVEESKKEDKPHKTFIGNPNEQTKKEVRKPFNPNNQNQNHNQNKNNNQKNFIARNLVDRRDDKSRKSTYASSSIDFGAIVSKTFPRN